MYPWTNLPELDKIEILGNCTRLPLLTDALQLQREIDSLPQEFWGSAGGRVTVHQDAESVFLRVYAPAQGDLPIEDRPALDHLPYLRSILETLIPAPPLRALLARLKPLGRVGIHSDRRHVSGYFERTLRIHVPIITNDRVKMIFGGEQFRMSPGEVWAVNNIVLHEVHNDDPIHARTHLIADFLPTPELLELINRGDRHLGVQASV